MSKIVFPEADFRQIGQAFIRRKANNDIDGEQTVEIDGSDSQDREGGSQRRESLRDASPFGDTDEASDDAEDDREESDGSVERLRAWKEGNEAYR